MKSRHLTHCVVWALVVGASSVWAAPVRERLATESIDLDSGDHEGKTDGTYVAFSDLIELPGAPWLQINFGEFHLGEASFVTLTSSVTGETQPLSATDMEVWRHRSARLRGDLVEVQLHVAPGDQDVFVTIESVTMPDISEWPSTPTGGVASICGDFDNRSSSSDSRVGRINGCTAWLVSTGVALTAGHCRNNNGDLTGGIEFNVPSSTSNGQTVPAALSDTYPVINWTGQEGGTGDDWLVFRIGTAADGSGKRAHVAQGFFHMTMRAPDEDDNMRVTGYGLDNIPPGTGGSSATCCDADSDDSCDFNCNANSRTQQTATGRFDELSGDTLEYEVDTMPANSGSPVIHLETGWAVGIHTAGGCGDTFAGDENHGTWFGDGPLANALNAYLGNNTVFVDGADLWIWESGGALTPHQTVANATAYVADGGTVLIAAGSYPASAGNTFTAGGDGKAMTLTSNTGIVRIGN